MPDEPTKVPEEQEKPPEQPQAPISGEAEKPEPSTLPDKFKGKSAEEIAKSYLEAEKELGRLRNQVGESEKFRQEVEQWRQLGNIIEGDPVLFSALETKIKGPKSNGVDRRDDTRVALEQNAISQFESRYAIDSLSDQARAELTQKIGTEIKEMYDPEGTRTFEEVRDSIPLASLPKVLDKAYRLATMGDTAERARLEGLIQAKQNNEASFGNMPSSSGKSDGVQLTPEQREAARKMHVTEEQYAKNLRDIAEGK